MMAATTKRTTKKDERRHALVSEAAALFDHAGYHAVGVGQLADAVGLSKPTLYHYFSSKDEILFFIHEQFIDILLEKASAQDPELPADQSLRNVMFDVVDLMRTHRGHVRVFFEHFRELSVADQETIKLKRDQYRELVEGIVRRGIKEGVFKDLDPGLVTLALFGMCNWAYQWFRADGPFTVEEVASIFGDLFLNGLSTA